MKTELTTHELTTQRVAHAESIAHLPALASSAISNSEHVTIADIVRLLRRQRVTVLAFFAITVLVVGIVSLLTPKKYDAVTRVSLSFDNSNSLNLDQILPVGFDPATKIQTQMRILQSETLAWEVIRDLKLYENPAFMKKRGIAVTNPDSVDPTTKTRLIRKFLSSLTVQLVPKTQIIEIKYRSTDPRLAADIANQIANNYIDRNFRTKYESTMRASGWLGKQLEDLKTKVRESQERLADYQRNIGFVGDESHNIITDKLNELNRAMAAAQSDRIVKEAAYRMAMEGTPDLVLPANSTPTLQALRTQEAEARAQYAQLSAKYGEAYPRVQQAKKQVEELHGAVAAELRASAARLKIEYDAAKRTEAMLALAVETEKQKTFHLNESAIQYSLLKHEVESSRDLYDGLLKKLSEAGIIAGLNSSTVDIVDFAGMPVEPASPRLVFNLSLGAIAGLIGGLMCGVLRENINTSIRTPDEVEHYCGMNSLGIIPRATPRGMSSGGAKSGREIVPSSAVNVLASGNTQFAEAFRAIRTSLLLSSPGNPPKVILVTSCVPREGKTTTSANVAMIFAQAGKKVLLVDADMRRPSIHRIMGVPNQSGLSAALAGADAQQAMVPSLDLPNLWIVPSGRIPPSPTDLVLSNRMAKLVMEWRAEFDHIIIDTPPALAVNEAVILSTLSDSVVVVARAGHTGRQSLKRLRQMLQLVNVRPTGVLVNDVALESAEYHDYYGYYGTYGEYAPTDGQGN